MNIIQINAAIDAAIEHIDGNNEVRDNLLKASGVLELLQIHIQNGDVKNVMCDIFNLAETNPPRMEGCKTKPNEKEKQFSILNN